METIIEYIWFSNNVREDPQEKFLTGKLTTCSEHSKRSYIGQTLAYVLSHYLAFAVSVQNQILESNWSYHHSFLDRIGLNEFI